MLPIVHDKNCIIHAAPDGDYVSDDDCDCGAVARWSRLHVAALEAALSCLLNYVDHFKYRSSEIRSARDALKGPKP